MNSKIAIITVLVLLVAGAGGYYFWQSRNAATTPKETAETTEIETPTEAPTPEEVDKSEFSIEIQNGSGVEGEAGRAQTLLEDNDFTVDTTGNADNYDYEETVIQAGEDVSEAWLDELRNTLEEQYTVESRVEDIGEDATSEVVVIVGSFDQDGESMAEEVDEESDESDDEGTTPSPEATSTVTTATTPTPTP